MSHWQQQDYTLIQPCNVIKMINFIYCLLGLRPSRSQLFVGIGHQQLAIQATLKSDRDAYNKLALESLERAVQQDGNDHLAEYYLSLQYALLNQLGDALSHIRFALALRMEHAPCLHLFALLLTASRRPREALGVVDDALHEFPDNLQLLHVKAHLQLHLEDAETALATVQHMLAVWRDVYEAQLAGEEEKHSDTKSALNAPLTWDCCICRNTIL